MEWYRHSITQKLFIGPIRHWKPAGIMGGGFNHTLQKENTHEQLKKHACKHAVLIQKSMGPMGQ